MRRFTDEHYRRRVIAPAFAYVLVTLIIGPATADSSSVWLKLLLIILQLAPMLYIVYLLARLIAHSDELEQRTHLIGLGVATVVVAVLSLVGGSLMFTGLVTLDGSVLFWVFPLLLISYQTARSWVKRRRYGLTEDCVSPALRPYQRLTLGAMMVLVLVLTWWRGRMDPAAWGMFCGIGAVWLIVEVLAQVRRRRRSAASHR